MNKLIVKILIFSLLLSSLFVLPVFSAVKENLIYFHFKNAEELVEFIETEDGETCLSCYYSDTEDPKNIIYKPGHTKTLSYYREREEIIECYFPEESDIKRSSIQLDSDTRGGVIGYQFSYPSSTPYGGNILAILVCPIDEECASVLESEGLQAYLAEKNYSGQYEEELTTTLGSGEEITYLKYFETNNDRDYIYFIQDGYLIQMYQLSDQIEPDILKQLHLKTHKIEKRPLQPGYGKLLRSRYTINTSGLFLSTAFEMATYEEIHQAAIRLLEERYGDFEAEILNESYIPAVGGTVDDPAGGTYGKYTYQIKLTDKYSRSFISNILTKSIEPSRFFGMDELQAEGNEVAVKIAPKQGSFHAISLAFYRDNVFLGLESQWTETERPQSFSAKIPEEANRIKAFLWDYHSVTDFVTGQKDYLFINPACPALEITKNEQGEWE